MKITIALSLLICSVGLAKWMDGYVRDVPHSEKGEAIFLYPNK